jgi:hypothetical protein
VTAEIFVLRNVLSSSVEKALRMARLCAEEGGQERQSKWPLEGVNNMFSNALKVLQSAREHPLQWVVS